MHPPGHPLEHAGHLGLGLYALLVFVVRQLDACVLGKPGDGLVPRHAEEVHQPVDLIAVGLAAKAVVEALASVHGERRRALAVKGAAGKVIATRALQRQVPMHQVNDVDPVFDRLNFVFGNHLLMQILVMPGR